MRFIDFKLFRFWYSSIYYEAYQTVSWWNNLDYLDISNENDTERGKSFSLLDLQFGNSFKRIYVPDFMSSHKSIKTFSMLVQTYHLI